MGRRTTRWITALLLSGACLLVASSARPGSADAQDNQTAAGVACNATGGSGGLAPGEHSVSIAGRPALLYVGAGYHPDRPTMLTYYLHGDGANTQNILSVTRRTVLDDNGWIYVAPRANNDRWWSLIGTDPAVNVEIERNAQLLEDVFESIFADYNVCRDVLLGSSASGGSWFYDGYFLPTRGDRYPAYMNLGCGSSGISEQFANLPFYPNLLTFNTNEDILSRTKLHYTIGTADFLFEGAERGSAHLESLGFDVTRDYLPGVEHCAFNAAAAAMTWWTQLCTDGFVPVASFTTYGAGRPESCNPGEAVCGGEPVTVFLAAGDVPTPADDVILGTDGDDVIAAGGGNDIICAGPGRDRIRGGPGDDQIYGGADIDRIWGEAGRDTIYGEGGSDRLFGGAARDVIFAGSGADRVYGGDGPDVLNGMGGQDRMYGQDGNDELQGNWQSDRLYGGAGDDVLRGAEGKDRLYGQDGNDQLFGGVNTDYLDGGAGVDEANGQKGRDRPLIADVSGCVAETQHSC